MQIECKHSSQKRLPRSFIVVAAGLVGVLAAILASPVVMPKIIRHHPEWLRLKAFQRYAAFRRKHSGHQHSATALLTHVGRRSKKTYQTPLGAQPYGDGFVVSLPYGDQTDWCRNVMTAGTCKLALRGQTYELERPEGISGSQVFQTMPVLQRLVLKGGGIHEFLWLHKTEISTAKGANIGG